MDQHTFESLLPDVARRARESGVFSAIEMAGDALVCRPRASGVDGEYAVTWDAGKGGPYVVLRSADRWLSESIEADLMHSGDDMAELIEDELAELGEDYRPVVRHYRDEAMRYTFGSVMPDRGGSAARAADGVLRLLLAYEAVFSELGEMSASRDD